MTSARPLLTTVADVVVPWHPMVPSKASALLIEQLLWFASVTLDIHRTVQMEELAQLQASRKGYKSHVTRLNHKMDELLASEFDKLTFTSLNTAIEQLNRKKEKLSQIDQRVAELIESPEDLEEAIFEAEEMQDSILDKITKVQTLIQLHTRKQTGKTSVPISTTVVSDNNTPLQDVTSQWSESTSPQQEEDVSPVL